MREPERIRRVVRNCGWLYGPERVPMGLLILFVEVSRAFADAEWGPGWFREWFHSGQVVTFLPALLLGVALLWLARVHYRSSFGSVQERDEGKLGAAILILALFIAAVGVASWLDARYEWPVLLTGLTLAAALVVWWRASEGLLPHYAVMAALLAAAGLAPLVLPYSNEQLLQAGLWVALGVIFTAGGVFDHLVLKRNMASMPEEENAAQHG